MSIGHASINCRNLPENEELALKGDYFGMKVFFLIRQLVYGGAERQLVELVKGLRARGIQVGVALIYPSQNQSFEDELQTAGATLYHFDKKGRWDLFGFLFRAARILRREAPDILYGFDSGTNILGSLLSSTIRQTRIIWTVQNAMKPSFEHWFPRFIFRLEEWMSRWNDLIITNSVAGSEYSISRGFPKEQIVVIPNGIDTDRFYPDPESGQSVRKEWRCPENSRLVGLVARYDPIKDHSTFLRTAAYLKKKRPDIKFVCVGDGPEEYQNTLMTLAAEMGLENRLIWSGPRTDMPAVYNAFDILCSSSLSEGISNVLCEAMACGVPCVATDVGDTSWVVGDYGVVVPPGDPEALAESCLKMLSRIEDEGDEIARRSRGRIVKYLSRDQLTERTLEAFKQLCGVCN